MENCNWVLDYDYPDLDLHQTTFNWPSSPPPPSSNLSLEELDDPNASFYVFKETGSTKRLRSESCNTSGSKACREKLRRDRLNDKFSELGSVLEPGRPPKMDKAVILTDAVRVVSQLRGEAENLRESTENLQEKINELKAEKNELRDEKQRLKAEKDKVEQKLKALSSQTSFLHHPSTLPAPFPAPAAQVVSRKLVPFMGYPGVSMWQFASVDTSQDHVNRPPVA